MYAQHLNQKKLNEPPAGRFVYTPQQNRRQIQYTQIENKMGRWRTGMEMEMEMRLDIGIAWGGA